MKKWQKTKGWTIGGAAALMFVTTGVQAASSFIPGSGCEATNSAYASQVVGGAGAVSNKNTASTLQVSCPMTTDLDSFTHVHAAAAVTKNTAAPMTCAVVTRTADNTAGTITSKSQGGVGFVPYFFDNVPQNHFNSVRCDIVKAGNANANSRTFVNGYWYHQH